MIDYNENEALKKLFNEFVQNQNNNQNNVFAPKVVVEPVVDYTGAWKKTLSASTRIMEMYRPFEKGKPNREMIERIIFYDVLERMRQKDARNDKNI